MSLASATQFIQLGLQDRTPLEGLLAEMRTSNSFDKNKIVQFASGMGYQFTLDEFHNAVGGYMEQYAAGVDPAAAALVLNFAGC